MCHHWYKVLRSVCKLPTSYGLKGVKVIKDNYCFLIYPFNIYTLFFILVRLSDQLDFPPKCGKAV